MIRRRARKEPVEAMYAQRQRDELRYDSMQQCNRQVPTDMQDFYVACTERATTADCSACSVKPVPDDSLLLTCMQQVFTDAIYNAGLMVRPEPTPEAPDTALDNDMPMSVIHISDDAAHDWSRHTTSESNVHTVSVNVEHMRKTLKLCDRGNDKMSTFEYQVKRALEDAYLEPTCGAVYLARQIGNKAERMAAVLDVRPYTLIKMAIDCAEGTGDSILACLRKLEEEFKPLLEEGSYNEGN